MGDLTNYRAPVVPLEYPFNEEPIRPCYSCLPWSAEVIADHPEGGIWIREWHAIGCEIVEMMTQDDD